MSNVGPAEFSEAVRRHGDEMLTMQARTEETLTQRALDLAGFVGSGVSALAVTTLERIAGAQRPTIDNALTSYREFNSETVDPAFGIEIGHVEDWHSDMKSVWWRQVRSGMFSIVRSAGNSALAVFDSATDTIEQKTTLRDKPSWDETTTPGSYADRITLHRGVLARKDGQGLKSLFEKIRKSAGDLLEEFTERDANDPLNEGPYVDAPASKVDNDDEDPWTESAIRARIAEVEDEELKPKTGTKE